MHFDPTKLHKQANISPMNDSDRAEVVDSLEIRGVELLQFDLKILYSSCNDSWPLWSSPEQKTINQGKN